MTDPDLLSRTREVTKGVRSVVYEFQRSHFMVPFLSVRFVVRKEVSRNYTILLTKSSFGIDPCTILYFVKG